LAAAPSLASRAPPMQTVAIDHLSIRNLPDLADPIACPR
jgi:hypothetical protein